MGVNASRVLIADADVTLREQLSSALLNVDVFSDSAATPTDALARLTADQYGVVVVDVAHDIDRVIAYIAGMPAAQRPVVLVLANNPEAARSLDVEIVQIVLRKPLNLSQLVDVVRSCVRSARRSRAAAAPANDFVQG